MVRYSEAQFMKFTPWITLFTLMTLTQSVAAEHSQPASEIRFNQQIRPLLSDNCFACHGPDSSSRKAELRLDTRAGAVTSGAIVPGESKTSELVARILSDDPDFMMPPPESRKQLSPENKQRLIRWIDAGANWEEHWSFIKPRKTKLPEPPGVKEWARNPIDHFVLSKLTSAGMKPNDPEARYTLARRAALDLTGLPPEPALIQEFVEDKQPGAYGRYVDSLLASKHAGEHRARYWLDAARYGDTHGMHVDNFREMWPYRDWVIGAFNSNMPFDQFVVEQIAGDLLPLPTLQQRIATGFSRCNITTSEGGAIPAELDVRYMVDRVETTGTVFLGLTLGCAVCHDHKYDPITQREFYQLGAFFNNTTQPAMDGNQKDTPPVVALPSEEYSDEWDHLLRQRSKLQDTIDRWPVPATSWWPTDQNLNGHPVASDELVLSLPMTEGEGDPFELSSSTEWASDHPFGKRGLRFGKDSKFNVDFPQLRSDQSLSLSFWFRTPDRLMLTTLFKQTLPLADNAEENTGKANDKPEQDKFYGWKIASGTSGDLRFEVFDRSGNKIRGKLPDNEALRPNSWQHVCVRYSGGQSNTSISILVNGRAAALRNDTEQHIEATDLAEAPLQIAGDSETAGLSDVRIFRRFLSDSEVQLLAQEFKLRELLKSPAKWSRIDPQDQRLLNRYYQSVLDESYRVNSRQLADTQTRRDFIYSRSTTTLVMQERASAASAWVLQRGEYDQPLDEVTPEVPTILPRLPQGTSTNRLGLAQWLVDPDHPLTARVTVNRLWQSLFGVGLVKTSEDFGVMGERPSHPELLDWLAVEFLESGWNVNHLLRLITTSATYRQNNLITTEKFELDAENRLLARGPRLRLDAEVLRDQALAVSGLLRRDIGGPSVRPYQPSGLWKVVAITGSNTSQFEQDSGDALYRRSLYTFWKRTSPPPSMAAFNAPTREQCTVRRERTNTPLQALVLMNDSQFVESARHLAQNAMQQPDGQARAAWMLTAVLGRPAESVDMAEMVAAAVNFRQVFRREPAATQALIQTGDSPVDDTLDPTELATWTMVANTLLNRDDFLNK